MRRCLEYVMNVCLLVHAYCVASLAFDCCLIFTLHIAANLKDIQALLDENEKFQQKVETQEQEFKLQNETMMKEVNEVCS